eukprot:1157541-Pelagomonas_calceolata.AAC.3
MAGTHPCSARAYRPLKLAHRLWHRLMCGSGVRGHRLTCGGCVHGAMAGTLQCSVRAQWTFKTLPPGCGTALRAEVACMVQWLARIRILLGTTDL